MYTATTVDFLVEECNKPEQSWKTVTSVAIKLNRYFDQVRCKHEANISLRSLEESKIEEHLGLTMASAI